MPDPLFLSGEQIPAYLRGVELMTAGMSWQASTGPVTITTQHIADAIVACNDDPHIQPPRIKLGHTSQINGDHPDHDPFAAIGDAEPAFGVFGKLAADNDGAVLVGDVDKILTWLAMSAPAAYPNRSAEATWAVESVDFDVQTAGGKRYSMVVTAISFLGVYAPAISDLEDLSALIMNGPSALTATAATTPVAAATNQPTAASISEDEIRQRFNWEWAMDPENELDTYWWWAREVRVTNGEVIADDDEGHLFQVPFTEKDGVITFGEPEQVRKTYIPMAASGPVACFARPSKPSRPAAAAATTPAATARPNTEEGASMDANVREILVGQGLDPDTATEEQVNAASVLDAAAAVVRAAQPATTPAANTEPEGDDGGEPVAEAEGVEPVAERVPVAAAAAPPASSLTLTVDKAQWEETQREIALSRADRRKTEKAGLDATISAALSKGQIAPASSASWRAAIDPGDNPSPEAIARAQAEQAALAALPEGRLPMEARAQAPDPNAPGEDGLTGADRELLAASRARMGFKTSQEA